MTEQDATTYEWRAVFSYPPSSLGPTPDTYGPPRASEAETEQDRPWRPEESRGWRSGTQRRTVTEWRPIPPAEPCRECGPGYRIGDEGCRHVPPGSGTQGETRG